MKLPNKYGSITKLSGNRRRPYIVRISDGVVFDEELEGFKINRPILGYFSSREEALAALVDYHNNPYELNKRYCQ